MPAFLRRRPRCAVLPGGIAASLLAGLGAPATAALAPPFGQLLRQSIDVPRLAEAVADTRRAEGQALQARARPNPTIGVLTENVGGSSPYQRFDRAETTLQFSQPIELGGKRSARIAAGKAGVLASVARGREVRITYAHDLALAYGAAEVAEGRIALADDEIEEATADLRAARALVGAGKEARLRALQAETSVNAVNAEREIAVANRIAAYARLAALAGVDEPYTGIGSSLLELETSTLVAKRLDPGETATVAVARAERAAAALRIDVERKRAVPDIIANVGVRRLEYEGATAVLGGVTIPLHIFDRNRGNIAVSQADLLAAEARLAAARFDAQAAVRAAYAQVAAVDARVAAAVASQATANETYRLARIAYEAGKAPLLELLTARHGLGAARGTVLDARAARLEARAELARMQGRNILGDEVQ